ncbi:hypothetical protein CMUS01_04218 [Colletotrichum musicola]|uniref:Uncharacterized protein n=1 Tax=Colletotrichum musicola TaxID=2175873 RepID=A0A8H6NNR3_9PEZI|nr:hypothetical protein CMUS01_04218 [Colletotrichum musicola]
MEDEDGCVEWMMETLNCRRSRSSSKQAQVQVQEQAGQPKGGPAGAIYAYQNSDEASRIDPKNRASPFEMDQRINMNNGGPPPRACWQLQRVLSCPRHGAPTFQLEVGGWRLRMFLHVIATMVVLACPLSGPLTPSPGGCPPVLSRGIWGWQCDRLPVSNNPRNSGCAAFHRVPSDRFKLTYFTRPMATPRNTRVWALAFRAGFTSLLSELSPLAAGELSITPLLLIDPQCYPAPLIRFRGGHQSLPAQSRRRGEQRRKRTLAVQPGSKTKIF